MSPTSLRVRYAETDAMGIVYYGSYLAYFEAARVELLRELGLEYPLIISRGFHLPVVEAQVRYRTPARFDDLLEIQTRPGAIGPVRFSLAYEVRRAADDARIASGQTTHACVDVETLRPRRLPAWLGDQLRQLSA